MSSVERFAPGHRLTFTAGGTIAAGKMVELDDDWIVGTAGNQSTEPAGVAAHAAVSGDKLSVITQGVVSLTASGSITQGARVVCAASGAVKAASALDGSVGIIVGYALHDAADAAAVDVKLTGV